MWDVRTPAWTTDDADAWIVWGGAATGDGSAAELVAVERGGASLMVAAAPPRGGAVRLGIFGHDRPVAATVASTTPAARAYLVRLVFDRPGPADFLRAARGRLRDPDAVAGDGPGAGGSCPDSRRAPRPSRRPLGPRGARRRAGHQ